MTTATKAQLDRVGETLVTLEAARQEAARQLHELEEALVREEGVVSTGLLIAAGSNASELGEYLAQSGNGSSFDFDSLPELYKDLSTLVGVALKEAEPDDPTPLDEARRAAREVIVARETDGEVA